MQVAMSTQQVGGLAFIAGLWACVVGSYLRQAWSKRRYTRTSAQAKPGPK